MKSLWKFSLIFPSTTLSWGCVLRRWEKGKNRRHKWDDLGECKIWQRVLQGRAVNKHSTVYAHHVLLHVPHTLQMSLKPEQGLCRLSETLNSWLCEECEDLSASQWTNMGRRVSSTKADTKQGGFNTRENEKGFLPKTSVWSAVYMSEHKCCLITSFRWH